jgi:predicted porin
MKKSLVALAVLAATGAYAQSSVTLGGTIGLSLGTVEYNGAPSRADIGRSSGAITLRGTEDLGGGLKASFVIQQGLYGFTSAAASTPSTSLNGNSLQNFGDRQLFVTLDGPFGTVKLGRDLNGASSAILGIGNVSGVRTPNGLDDNTGSAVYIGNVRSTSLSYTTPQLSGFSAYVGITPQNYAGLTASSVSTLVKSNAVGITADNTISAAATRQDVPMAVGVVYSQGPFSAGIDITNYQEAFAALGNNGKVTSFAANYDLGVAKIGGIYQSARGDAKANTNSAILTVRVPVSSALSLGAAYGRRSVVASGSFSALGTKHVGLGADYALSKRTVVYLGYTNRNVGNSAVAGDIKETGIGVFHSF